MVQVLAIWIKIDHEYFSNAINKWEIYGNNMDHPVNNGQNANKIRNNAPSKPSRHLQSKAQRNAYKDNHPKQRKKLKPVKKNKSKSNGIPKYKLTHTVFKHQIHFPIQYEMKPQFYKYNNNGYIYYLPHVAKEQDPEQILKEKYWEIIQHRIRWTVVVIKNNQ